MDTPMLRCNIGKSASRQTVSVSATPDSGCTMGVARSSIVKQCGAAINPTSATLEAANGASMRVQGQATLFVKVSRVSVKQIDVLVSDDIVFTKAAYDAFVASKSAATEEVSA